jgi:hypothetical protein
MTSAAVGETAAMAIAAMSAPHPDRPRNLEINAILSLLRRCVEAGQSREVGLPYSGMIRRFTGISDRDAPPQALAGVVPAQ